MSALRLAALAATIALAASAPAIADEVAPVTLRVMTFNIWYGGIQADETAVIDAIRAADADIVGLQEPDGSTARIAAAAGYAYVDLRRHIISRFPLFDSGLGERTETGQAPYAMVALDSNAAHVWAMVAPGQVVALANLHLSSDPFGPDLARDGATLDAILANEAELRMPEIDPLAAALEPLVAGGVPVIVTGDFNSPSHLDWTIGMIGARPALTMAVPWPVTLRMQAAGFTDAFRAAHPDPALRPGLTYSPGFPWPVMLDTENHDRIDYVFVANADVLSAQVLGEQGNADVNIALDPWPSDHRAVVATLQVVPVAAPPLIAVEPRLVEEGQSLILRTNLPGRGVWGAVIVPRGGDAATQGITGVEAVETWWQNAIRLSTFGLSPGPFDAVLQDVDGVELARTRFSVLARDGRPSITATTPVVAQGQGVGLRWSGAPGFRFDWIGIYARGEVSVYNYLAFAYTGATLDGEMTLTPDLYYQDLAPGDYELRLMADDHYQTLATAPFTVTAP